MRWALAGVVIIFADAAAAQTMDCVLSPVAVHSFEAAKWKSENAARGAPLHLTFSNFDFERRRAQMIGNSSSVEVQLIPSKTHVTTIEVTEVGRSGVSETLPPPIVLWG